MERKPTQLLIAEYEANQDPEVLEQIADRYIEASQLSDGSGSNEEAVEMIEEWIDLSPESKAIYDAINLRYTG